MQARKEMEQEAEAATKIQATFRGSQVRKERQQEDEAATKIQAAFRGSQVRKESLSGFAGADEFGDSTDWTDVAISRHPGQSYGFNLGEVTTPGDVVVVGFAAGGVSAGKLMVSDVLRVINGTPTKGKDFDTVVKLLSASNSLDLKVERFALQRTQTASGRGPAGTRQVVMITRKPGESFGLNLGEGAIPGEMVITGLAAGGVSEGRLRVNDVIRSVNGTKTVGMTFLGVVQLLASYNELKLEVDRLGNFRQ